jgi:SAM-dependent methyltransferase
MARIDSVNPEHFDDPVAAYDRLAAHYPDLSRRRELYLRGIEREIISRIPPRSRSLLDIGAGDGTRTAPITSASGVHRIVLLEPSTQMRAHGRSNPDLGSNRDLTADSAMKIPGANVEASSEGAPFVSPVSQVTTENNRVPEGRHMTDPRASADSAHVEIWPIRAEDLTAKHLTEHFDVVTCLWNVLGHISAENRQRTLGAVAQLLCANGKFFLDVNHRYNLRAYGFLPTCARWIRDHLFGNESNGDVVAKWNVDDLTITTYGHVFTHREIARLAAAAGLELEERIVIDYENGGIRQYAFQGNLLYVFRRSSRIDSSSAPETS